MSAESAVRWAYPDIVDAQPLGDDDHELVSDLHEVLRKHNAVGRFGITLLHTHFRVGPNEVILEETDVDGRHQTMRPVPSDSLQEEGIVETSWSLDTGRPIPLTMCRQGCTRKRAAQRV
jgi:hypothetical protein